jgi:electron transfer flavoprotein beta subunit
VRIVVCIKHVLRYMAYDASGKTADRESVPGTINPNDRVAIARALALKSAGDEIICLSMGPPAAEESLREALAMGVDRAILLCDRALAGADTLATAYPLSMAVRKIGNVDLVICGSRSVDSDTGHVAPQVAEMLDVPYLSYVTDFSVEGSVLSAERTADGFIEQIEADMPALLAVSHHVGGRAYPSLGGLNRAFTSGVIETWSAGDICSDPDRIGRKGSPTWVNRIITPEKQRIATVFEDDRTQETPKRVLEMLKARNIMIQDKIRARRNVEEFEL